MQSWGSYLQLRKPRRAGCWEGGVTKWFLYITRVLYSSLNQAPAPGRPRSWDPQGDNPLVWPALAISGCPFSSWQHQPGVSAFPSKWGELSLQSIPHALASVNVLRRELPPEQTRGGSQWGSSCSCRALREEVDVWQEEAAHSPSSGGATITRAVQMCSYCSPTMNNFTLTTTFLLTAAQGGLTCSRHPPRPAAQELNPQKDHDLTWGWRWLAQHQGGWSSKFVNFISLGKKKEKSQKYNTMQDQLLWHFSDKQKSNQDKSRLYIPYLPVFPSAPYLLLAAWLTLCRSSNMYELGWCGMTDGDGVFWLCCSTLPLKSLIMPSDMSSALKLIFVR